MAHGKLSLIMPASKEAAFEAFFNHAVRTRWDTLLRANHIEGGGDHPYVGAVTVNSGSGWKRLFGMRTRFLVYDPPNRGVAELTEPAGLFSHWAATIHFREMSGSTSQLYYNFTFRLRPRWIGLMIEPLAGWLYLLETRRRFLAMAEYLQNQP